MDADQQRLGPQRQADGLGGRPAARLEDRNADARLQRQARVGNVAQRAGHLRLALRVGLGDGQRRDLFLELVGREAEIERAVGGERRRIGGDGRFRLAVETGRGRAIEEDRVGIELHRLAGPQEGRGAGHRDLELLRDEILHVEFGMTDRGTLRVEIGVDAPMAVGRGIGEGQRLVHSAVALILERDAAKDCVVGAPHDQRHRHAGHRVGSPVAQQGHDVDRLARAINAAVGIDETIDRPGQGTAVDAAVGKIERRTGEVGEVEIAVGAIGHHRGGRRAARPLRQAGIKMRAAVGVGGRHRQFVVVVRDQGQLQTGHRRGAAEGAREYVEPVRAFERGERDVGIDHPLHRARPRVVVVARSPIVFAPRPPRPGYRRRASCP